MLDLVPPLLPAPLSAPLPASLSAGAGLELRPWRTVDAQALVRAFRDPVLRRFLRTMIDNESDAAAWIEARTAEWADGSRFSFAVHEGSAVQEGGAVQKGSAGLAGYVAVRASGEVGYWTRAEFRGRGVASLAVEAMSQWALGSGSFDQLELIHATDNPASCRVAQKCGFTQVSELPAEPPAFPVTGHLHIRLAASLSDAKPATG
jgi:RimJ/RimL family protein N-acetyltransferase